MHVLNYVLERMLSISCLLTGRLHVLCSNSVGICLRNGLHQASCLAQWLSALPGLHGTGHGMRNGKDVYVLAVQLALLHHLSIATRQLRRAVSCQGT